ncbi:MAG: VWA domain-containing protein [Succinatimonas sp.]|nr:VWA domain-containing protein [Succinatimonas sp.]
MLRVKRIKKADLSLRSGDLCRNFDAWISELSSKLDKDCVALLPYVESDGEYFNFLTKREGGCNELSKEALNPEQQKEYLKRSQVLCEFLDSKTPLSDTKLEAQRAYLSDLIKRSSHIMVFERGVPLLLPMETLQEEALNKTAVMPVIPPPHRGCLLPFLLGLLGLLLLLALLWYFFLRPWPFEKGEVTVKDPPVPSEPVKTPVLQQEEEVAEDPEDELKAKALEEERQRLEAEKLKKQQEEQKLKAEQERQKKLEAERKAAELKKQQAKNSKPKCRVMREQGTLPKMVIAFDGSQSMLLDDVPGSSSRLAAAKSSARKLADSIDKNVEIGLVEINGCPAAKSRGFYSGIQRSALKGTISGINPMRYDGKTPLIDGLQQISKMTDGVNADAVGVLISDGEDTCPATANLDVCQVARAIHKRQPRLKIHTILIGEDASQAACVARITGGKVFSPQNAHEIDAGLQSSGNELKKVCDE